MKVDSFQHREYVTSCQAMTKHMLSIGQGTYSNLSPNFRQKDLLTILKLQNNPYILQKHLKFIVEKFLSIESSSQDSDYKDLEFCND